MYVYTYIHTHHTYQYVMRLCALRSNAQSLRGRPRTSDSDRGNTTNIDSVKTTTTTTTNKHHKTNNDNNTINNDRHK